MRESVCEREREGEKEVRGGETEVSETDRAP